MKSVSKKRSTMLYFRKIIKSHLERIYKTMYGVTICSRCRVSHHTIDLDEIRGHRIQETGLLGELDPSNLQLLCRGCHTIKTNYLNGHYDFRDEGLKKLMKEATNKAIGLLPKMYGELKWNTDQQFTAVVNALYYISGNIKHKPGTDMAIACGCKCPIMDNNYGKGVYEDGKSFYYNMDCEYHEFPKSEGDLLPRGSKKVKKKKKGTK
jgi:hypothetical protein